MLSLFKSSNKSYGSITNSKYLEGDLVMDLLDTYCLVYIKNTADYSITIDKILVKSNLDFKIASVLIESDLSTEDYIETVVFQDTLENNLTVNPDDFLPILIKYEESKTHNKKNKLQLEIHYL